MCRPASFVLTKDRVFWSINTDSHEDIIAEHKLHQDGVRGPNILRIEITPPDDDFTAPAKKWNFRLDQDIMPAWFDAEKDEKRARLELAKWIKSRVIRKDCKELCSGRFIICDSARVGSVYGSASVGSVYDSAVVRQYGGTVAAPVGPQAVVIDARSHKAVCIVGE